MKFHLKLKFFKKEKMENFEVDFYNILTIGIDIIEFDVNIISKLVLLSFYTFFYFIFFWKVITKVFSLVIFFINSQLNLLP